MTDSAKTPLLRLAILSGIAGVLTALPLLVSETPYTLTAFMFFAQPLLVVAFLLFVAHVLRHLRDKEPV